MMLLMLLLVLLLFLFLLLLFLIGDEFIRILLYLNRVDLFANIMYLFNKSVMSDDRPIIIYS